MAKDRPADETEGDVNTDEKLQLKGVAISPEKQNKEEGSSQPVSVTRVLFYLCWILWVYGWLCGLCLCLLYLLLFALGH